MAGISQRLLREWYKIRILSKTSHMGLTPIKLVIASPGDVKAERSVVTLVADELNKTLAQKLGFQFMPLMWETDAYPGFHIDGPQALIDEGLTIKDSDIVVGFSGGDLGPQLPTLIPGQSTN